MLSHRQSCKHFSCFLQTQNASLERLPEQETGNEEDDDALLEVGRVRFLPKVLR